MISYFASRDSTVIMYSFSGRTPSYFSLEIEFFLQNRKVISSIAQVIQVTVKLCRDSKWMKILNRYAPNVNLDIVVGSIDSIGQFVT
jgi:exosome complex RNA-binding protein Rrp4